MLEIKDANGDVKNLSSYENASNLHTPYHFTRDDIANVNGTNYIYSSLQSLMNGDQVILYVKAPTGTNNPGKLKINLEGNITCHVYETPTTTNDGSSETLRNKNRNFLDNSNSLLYSNPTVSDNGTLIMSLINSEEFYMKNDLEYLIIVTSLQDTNTVCLTLNLTEEAI